jgi:phytanoyl-CoA hydroxylase
MLTEIQIKQFHRDGFLKGSRILNEDQVSILQGEMECVIQNQNNAAIPQPSLLRNLGGNEDTPVWQIVNIWKASSAFRTLAFNRTITEEIAQLTHANELRLWHDQIQYKPAAKGGINRWHQDAPYWPVLTASEEVTAWVALDDVDEENGCMVMAPGSHRWGVQLDFLHLIKNISDMPKTFQNHDLTVKTCPVKKGEVHYHHSLTWHGSDANKSGRPRRAVAMHYVSEKCRYIANDRSHALKPLITVNNGEKLSGEHFPLVWDKEKLAVSLSA